MSVTGLLRYKHELALFFSRPHSPTVVGWTSLSYQVVAFLTISYSDPIIFHSLMVLRILSCQYLRFSSVQVFVFTSDINLLLDWVRLPSTLCTCCCFPGYQHQTDMVLSVWQEFKCWPPVGWIREPWKNLPTIQSRDVRELAPEIIRLYSIVLVPSGCYNKNTTHWVT